MRNMELGMDVMRSHELLSEHESLIRTALRVYAERMDESAKTAQLAYDLGQSSPEVKAEQDKTYVTNIGYKHLAEMARQSAESARKASGDILNVILGMGEAEGGNEQG
ncbi:hypothetical protein ACFWAN_32430 [Streptomyces mirabilis]|uniref:hypothetical protein n=1 Tax=Streptomyces mirabilis TaxID=68239 RepID=UPI00364E4FE6